jgi:hypothetical protein
MPLTPASWADDLEGAARQSSTTQTNDTVPTDLRRTDSDTGCTRLINRTSFADL